MPHVDPLVVATWMLARWSVVSVLILLCGCAQPMPDPVVEPEKTPSLEFETHGVKGLLIITGLAAGVSLDLPIDQYCLRMVVPTGLVPIHARAEAVWTPQFNVPLDFYMTLREEGREEALGSSNGSSPLHATYAWTEEEQASWRRPPGGAARELNVTVSLAETGLAFEQGVDVQLRVLFSKEPGLKTAPRTKICTGPLA